MQKDDEGLAALDASGGVGALGSDELRNRIESAIVWARHDYDHNENLVISREAAVKAAWDEVAPVLEAKDAEIAKVREQARLMAESSERFFRANLNKAAEIQRLEARYELAVEDWARNDGQVLAENQRLADELALALERIAKTRQALRLNERWSVQHGALAVRSERDRAVAERDALREQLAEAVELLDNTIDEDPCEPDHNQNCQAHGWFSYGASECNNARVKRFVQANSEGATSADSSPKATSAASTLIHLVTLSSDTGVMGEWQAFCHGCEQRAKGDMPRVAFWRDQREADTLIPILGQEAQK